MLFIRNSLSRNRQHDPPQWIEPPPVPSDGGRCKGFAVPSGLSAHGSSWAVSSLVARQVSGSVVMCGTIAPRA